MTEIQSEDGWRGLERDGAEQHIVQLDREEVQMTALRHKHI